MGLVFLLILEEEGGHDKNRHNVAFQNKNINPFITMVDDDDVVDISSAERFSFSLFCYVRKSCAMYGAQQDFI